MSDKTLIQLLQGKSITQEDVWKAAFANNGNFSYYEDTDHGKVSKSGHVSIQEAFSTPDAAILFPKVIQNVLEEAAEPRQILTPLLSTVSTTGRAVEFPAVGALRAAEIPEGQEYPDQSLIFERRLEGKVSKKGLKIPFTDEVISDSQWDIVGLHVRAAGRAMMRLKEAIAQERFNEEAVSVMHNTDLSGTPAYQTSGVDADGDPNGSLALDDILKLAGYLIADERNFTHLIMHPMAWIILATDPTLRNFQIYGARDVYTAQVPSGRNLYEDKSFLSMFPWVPSIILSPYVRWDADGGPGGLPTTDIYAIDSEDIGSILVREEIVTEEWDDPSRDIRTLKLKERYDIVVYGEHNIKLVEDVVVTKNYGS